MKTARTAVVVGALMTLIGTGSALAEEISLSGVQQNIVNSLVADDIDSFVQGDDSMISGDLDAKFYQAQEIFDDYDANQVAADVKYLNKKVIVRGKIDSINSGLGNTPYVVFKIKRGFGGPQAHFNKDQIPEVAKLKKGAATSFLCVASGSVVGTPTMKGCIPENALRATLLATAQKDVASVLNEKKAPKYAYRVVVLALATDESKITKGACANVGRKCAVAAVDTLKKMPQAARDKALDDAAKRVGDKNT